MVRQKAPAGSRALASTRSTPLSTILGSMLNASQNDYAEILLRVAAVRRGRPATWAGATANAMAVLKAEQIGTYHLVMRDASGLSRSDRMPTATLTSLLFRVSQDPVLSSVILPRTALPVAGQTGTLATRFRTSPYSCAAGRVHAKTGTLADVVALSGYAEGIDGRCDRSPSSSTGSARPSRRSTRSTCWPRPPPAATDARSAGHRRPRRAARGSGATPRGRVRGAGRSTRPRRCGGPPRRGRGGRVPRR